MSIPPKTSKADKGGKATRTVKKAKTPKASKARNAAAEIDESEEVPIAKPVAAKSAKVVPGGNDAALEKRLPEMTDFQLRAYQMSTARISQDTKHAKSAAAKNTLAVIEKEMARRVASPGSAPAGVRAPVASPKVGKKRAD